MFVLALIAVTGLFGLGLGIARQFGHWEFRSIPNTKNPTIGVSKYVEIGILEKIGRTETHLSSRWHIFADYNSEGVLLEIIGNNAVDSFWDVWNRGILRVASGITFGRTYMDGCRGPFVADLEFPLDYNGVVVGVFSDLRHFFVFHNKFRSLPHFVIGNLPLRSYGCHMGSICGFISDVIRDDRSYGHDESEARVDNQKNHCPMSRVISFLFQPESSAVEAVVFGLIGMFIFRLGFYRDNEWLCAVGGIVIFLATVSFVVSTSRIIIRHI